MIEYLNSNCHQFQTSTNRIPPSPHSGRSLREGSRRDLSPDFQLVQRNSIQTIL